MPKITEVAVPGIDRSIHTLRGHRVLLDQDLARLYGVETKRLNEVVKRNNQRFPMDFMFELTAEEAASLRSQSATSKGRGGRRSLPRAFTEQGVAMLSSVLNSERAIAVNIEIMRTFVKMRAAIAVNAELAKRLALVEAKLDQHRAEMGESSTRTAQMLKEHENHIRVVFEAIRSLMVENENSEPPKRVGFKLD